MKQYDLTRKQARYLFKLLNDTLHSLESRDAQLIKRILLTNYYVEDQRTYLNNVIIPTYEIWKSTHQYN